MKLRRFRRYVPSYLAVIGWVLLVVALVTGAETAWSFSACAYAWAWFLRDWSKVTTVDWSCQFNGHRYAGTTDTIDEARRHIDAIRAEWTETR